MALNQDTMLICHQEFAVKEYFPLRVEYLSVTVSHKNLVRALSTGIKDSEILK
jgi:hypothetical protein